jgi:hypothetical protein
VKKYTWVAVDDDAGSEVQFAERQPDGEPPRADVRHHERDDPEVGVAVVGVDGHALGEPGRDNLGCDRPVGEQQVPPLDFLPRLKPWDSSRG